MAVYGYPFQPGDRVLTARAEYASNVIALLQLRDRFGIEIVLVDDDEHGQISPRSPRGGARPGAAMVALTHVPTNGGLVNPAEAVGALCAAHDVFYVLDACQSVGQVPVDVSAIGCDVLSATGRKYLRAPRGTGFLYVSDRALDRLVPPFLDLHAATWTGVDTYEIRDDARRFENWETSHATKLGLGAAVDYALALGPESTWSRIEALGAALRERLGAVDGVTVHDKGERRGGIVTFTVDGPDGRRGQGRADRPGDQHLGVTGRLGPLRPARAGPAGPRAGVGALLQHRRRARRPGRGAGLTDTPGGALARRDVIVLERSF